MKKIDFNVNPKNYKHWKIEIDKNVCNLIFNVDEDKGLIGDYKLKLNSYDLGVDIELYDVLQRLRFEYPQLNLIIIKSGNERAFSAGANIKMLAEASHAHKVNFCKYTNETRNFIESSSSESGQYFICSIEGVCADDIRAGFKIGYVYGLDCLGLCDVEEVVVALQIFDRICERRASKFLFLKLMRLNHCAHGSVEDHNVR